MRSTPSFLLFSCVLVVTAWAAADQPAAAPLFTLPDTGVNAPASQFSPSQLAFVQSWIRQIAPECPVELSASVAQSFLEELSISQSGKFDRLLAPDFPARTFDSMLLRHVATKLKGASLEAAREKIAERRVTALLGREGLPATGAAGVIGRIRDDSSYQHRRLLEGKVEDDDLVALLRKSDRPVEKAAVTTVAAPKELTAMDIVSEFARRNQTGSAMQRLQGLTIEARFTTAAGEVQLLVVSKMRPDRMRLVMVQDGISTYTLGGMGERFWQKTSGQSLQYAAGKDLGARRYMTEFADPLFTGDGYTFERLPDGSDAGKAFYRIGVRRRDGSQYVTRIEPGTFHQVGRENPDRTIARYSDFREIAGVTFAFREEITDGGGRKGVLDITRVNPNPGLVEAYFFPPVEPGLDYRQVEQFLARGPGRVSSSR